MPTDPNDKMRTPGAAARRDMDGRANQPPKKRSWCFLLALLLLAIPTVAGFDIVGAVLLVTS